MEMSVDRRYCEGLNDGLASHLSARVVSARALRARQVRAASGTKILER
jgi:hypothetical protein